MSHGRIGVVSRLLLATAWVLTLLSHAVDASDEATEHEAAEVESLPAFELMGADIGGARAALEAGSVSAAALTAAYLERIDRLDRSGPVLNTLIHVNETALDQAAALDAERALSGVVGPLHGIPLVIRDDLDTLDQPTTAGSATLRGHEPLADAFVVGRLREAGAVLLGKANLSELGLALGRYGYSSAAGQTRNPYNLRRAPSFAGDAAAVAANLAMGAVGTDMAGSLRAAAAANGVVAVKPSLGLTSRAGAVPTAWSFQVPGPVARSVRDAALILSIIAGQDPADPSTVRAPEQRTDYLASLDDAGVGDVRLGIANAYCGGSDEVDAAFDAALGRLRGQGATLTDIDLPEGVLNGRAYIIDPLLEAELKDQIGAYLLNTEQGMPHSLAELLRMSKSPLIAGSPMPVSPRHLATYRRVASGPGLASFEVLDALSRRLPETRAAVRALFAEQELDAIVFPTMLCPASSLLVDYDQSYDCDAEDPYQPAYLASIAGLPELTTPMGYTKQGLPIGLSLVSPAFSEARLLALGHAVEQLLGTRRPPPLPEVPSLPVTDEDPAMTQD